MYKSNIVGGGWNDSVQKKNGSIEVRLHKITVECRYLHQNTCMPSRLRVKLTHTTIASLDTINSLILSKPHPYQLNPQLQSQLRSVRFRTCGNAQPRWDFGVRNIHFDSSSSEKWAFLMKWWSLWKRTRELIEDFFSSCILQVIF